MILNALVPAGSSYASDIDGLITLITVLVGFWFLLAEGLFFYFIFKFKAKDGKKAQYITGEHQEKKWVHWPHNLILIFDVIIVVIAAVKVWYTVKQDLPPAQDERVRIIAQQWAWTFVHPGPDGQLDTADDITTVDELHVAGRTRLYHFELDSQDVLHSFSVPVFRLKQDAVPAASSPAGSSRR